CLRHLGQQYRGTQSHAEGGEGGQGPEGDVLPVSEIRAVLVQRGRGSCDQWWVQRGHGNQPATGCRIAVWPTEGSADPLVPGPSFYAVAFLRGTPHFTRLGEGGQRRGVGTAGERGAQAQCRGHRHRSVPGQLANGVVGTEVVGDGVEPAGMHDACADGDGGVVVTQIHLVDELWFAGQVDIVGPGGGTRGNQRFAVVQVWADRGDDHSRRFRDLSQ